MPAETYSPAQASRRVGVALSTLRTWCPVYAEFLSAGANPPAGEPKRFTSGDCDILRTVANLRANGLEPAQIADRLRADPTAAMQTPVDAPQSPVPSSTSLTTTPTGVDALASFVVASDARIADVARQVAATDKHIADIDKRLASAEHTRNLLLAFAAGAVLMGVIAWLFVMLR